jgi:hypothetical protein
MCDPPELDVTTPDLLGLPESEATDMITEDGLVPSVSHQKTCTDPGDVLNQNEAG